MKLGQIKWNNAVTAAIFNGAGARPIPDYNLYELICRSEKEGVPLTAVAGRLAAPHHEACPPLIPLQPREVWACDSTYDAAGLLPASRPALYFKGTSRVCVGPTQPIGLRPDSHFTIPEPELALVLGSKGRILGYTLANDVSAWDLERENPLYLQQSKLYACACSLGPVMVTTDEIQHPYSLNIECTIQRNGQTMFSGEAGTDPLESQIGAMIEYLLRSNPVPAGSVLLTGTGIAVKEESALAPGDVVTIRIAEIGELVNPAALVN